MKRIGLLGFLLILSACVPNARSLPPDAPLVYATPYPALFGATLQAITSSYLPAYASRSTFSITEADRQTGLITATRNEPRHSGNLIYHTFGGDDGLGFRFAVPVHTASNDKTVITLVVRPVGPNRASLIYSTQGPDGRSSADAERLMQLVMEKLDVRFRTSAPPEKGSP